MIGIFDSGEGGENALDILRGISPGTDILLFKDRKNAPFGRRSEEELVRITLAGVDRLLTLGCERVLIACCTASTVHPRLPEFARRASVPIIAPTVSEALKISRGGRISVIATDATVRSHAFGELLGASLGKELAASPLVDAIESGERDGMTSQDTQEYLRELLSELSGTGTDTLILGCTHFSRLWREIREALPPEYKEITTVIDSAEAGAKALLSGYGCRKTGRGRIRRIE